MLTRKAPQDENRTQTTSYTSTITKQVVKGLALIGLCAAGMYGVAQWFFSTTRNKEDENIEENSIVLTTEKATSASISEPHLTKELDLTYQTNEFSKDNINYHVKRESTNSNTPLKYGDMFQVSVFPPYYSTEETIYDFGSCGLTILSNGRLVLVWGNYMGVVNKYNLKARIFDKKGNFFTDELLIRANNLAQVQGYVASLTEGFVTTFLLNDHYVDYFNIYAQLLDTNGVALRNIIVNGNETIFSKSDMPMLEGLNNGNFVIGYEGESHEKGSYQEFIGLRIFNNKGVYLTGDILIETIKNKYINNRFSNLCSIIKLNNGGFVVAWGIEDENNNSTYNFQTFNEIGKATNKPVSLLVSDISSSLYTIMPVKGFSINDSFLVAVKPKYSNPTNASLANIYDEKGSVVMSNFSMNAELLTNINNNGYAVSWVNRDSKELPFITLQLFSSQLQAQGKLTYLQSYGHKPPASMLYTNLIGMIALPNNDIAVAWATGDYTRIVNSGVYSRIINFVTNSQLTAFFINFTDNYQQDSSYIFSNTEIDCFNCTQPITFTAIISDVNAGYLTSSFNKINVTTNFDPSLGRWQVSGFASDVNLILKELTYIPALNYHENFTLAIQVSDTTGSTVVGNITMNGIPTYYAPIITNVLTLNQGEKITLTSRNLEASVRNQVLPSILFYVTGVEHGHFYTDNNVTLLSFSQQQITDGQIHFVHNNSTQAPYYSIIAFYKQINSTSVSATVYFNRPPVLRNNQLTIHNQGEKIILDASMLSAIDPDDPQDQLKFIVTSTQHGQLELVDKPGQAIIGFIQKQIGSGEVAFVHDGSDQTPAYQVSVTDSKATTVPQSAAVKFLPKIAETPNNQSYNNMVIGTTVGVTGGTVALIGGIYGLWRYRKSREFAEQRKKHPLADALREKLRLADVEDFQSDKGLSYLNAIARINNELRTQGIDVGQMLAEEIEQLAGYIARGIKKMLHYKKTCTGAIKLDFNELGKEASLILESGIPLNGSLKLDASVSEIEFSNVM